MALSDQEETAVRGLLAAVGSAGLTADQLVATLRIGRLTTEIASMDAQVGKRQADAEAGQQAAQADIAKIRQQQDDLRGQLRDIQGA